MNQDSHADEKQERLKEKLRDELGPVIVGLLDQSSGLEDILVNEDSCIWVKRTGSPFERVGELSSRQARGAMMTIASMQKTTVTEMRPVLETQLPIWKYRFAGLIEPVVPSPSFAIRVKSDKKRSLRELQRQGILTMKDDPRNRRSQQEDFIATVRTLDHLEVIQQAILAHKNILIVGGTGAGKTTIANAILEEIGTLTPGDRVLVIEDTQELLLDSANSLSMLATTDFDQLKCLKVALRLKPDRIVVGEVRDGAAALPLLKSWNTGHPGGVSTLHANSATEALDRLEALVREATDAPQQRMIGSAVDLVISVVNDPVAGRKVQEVGMPPEWTDQAFVNFYDALAKPSPSHDEFESLSRLYRAFEARYGEVSADTVQAATNTTRLTAVRLLRALRDEATMPRRSFSAKDRDTALRILRQNSPVGRLISRNTRDLLRRYYKEGRISTPIADREVDDRFLDMSDDERHIYELVEVYIRETYNKASASTKTAVGFVMTIYRKRLASSFYALTKTLEKRLAAIKKGDGSISGTTDEDLPDDDLAEELLDSDEVTEMEREALNFEERSSIEDLLLRVSSLPPDTKARELRTVIDELRASGYNQVMVFTQFTDTMDFLRDQLRAAPGLKMMCYSGRGGEIPIGDSEWEQIPRDQAKRRFKNGDADVLLCTDAAAEGLNFQFCGALINYDLPWNPMRVEQRIGRIDRVGQKYPKIRIVNLQYDDTIETAVYRVLQERIGFFTSVVGKLQPILSSVPQRIAAAVLGTDTPSGDNRLIAGIEEAIATTEGTSFDLDSLVVSELEMGQRPEALYCLGNLRDVLARNEVFLPDAKLEATHGNEFQYVTPGMKKLRITVSPEYYDTHAGDVELWSPGSPAFPEPIDVADREVASEVDLASLLP